MDERNTCLSHPDVKQQSFFPLLDSDMGSRSESLGCRREMETRPTFAADTGTHPEAFVCSGVPRCGDKVGMPRVCSVHGHVSLPGPCSQGLPSQCLTQIFTPQVWTAPQRADRHRKHGGIIAESSLLLENSMTRTAKPMKAIKEQASADCGQ